MLQLNDIRGGYSQRADKWILHGIHLEIEEGQTVAVIGKNGAGKSTLAKSIVNLLPYKSGSIRINGKDISRLPTEKMTDCGISYFVQGGRVFPQLNPMENLRFAGRHLKRKEWNQRLNDLAVFFEILGDTTSQKLNTPATWLSGGERHQLALAMALFTDPKLLILDEPSAGLSPANVLNIYTILQRIRKEKGVGILLIEQNVKQAVQFAREVLYLERGRFTQRFQKEDFENIHQFLLK